MAENLRQNPDGSWSPAEPIEFGNWLGSGRLARWWHDHVVERIWQWRSGGSGDG